MARQNIPGLDGENAISLYQPNDSADEFPVLKAFQQYIDAEQTKARKRMVMLSIFFGVLMTIVIAVFVVMLMGISQRNQALNDRLIEFAMKERTIPQQQPVQQSDLAVAVMTTQIQLLQKQMEENKLQAEKSLAEANERARKAETEAQTLRAPVAQNEEVARLKALLAAEKEKAAAEREKAHQAEIEAYRRKYYPEFYQQPKPVKPAVMVRPKRENVTATVLDDDDAIDYFDEADDDEENVPQIKPRAKVKPTKPATAPMKAAKTPQAKAKAPEPVPDEKPIKAPLSKPEKTIQLNVGGKTSSWSIPND